MRSLLALTLTVLSAAQGKEATGKSLFAGHHGYVLEYPTPYEARARFATDPDGSRIELVDFIPPGCGKAGGRRRCGDLGLLTVYVSPKAGVVKMMGTSRLAEQVAIMARRAGEAGEAPGAPAAFKIGRLAGLTFARAAPKGASLEATTVVEGTNVVYVFEHQRANAAARRIIESLLELKP
jgi:hypothetical protein